MIKIYINDEYYAKVETFEEALRFTKDLEIDDKILFIDEEFEKNGNKDLCL